RYFLTGETFDPSAAVEIGLVTEAFASADDLDAGLASVLAGIRRASPQGLAASKMLTTATVLSSFRGLARQRADESAAL
ncbi:enoyl-CoA hydratase, partial [Streptomyces sp. SID10244]|nr:enoyl-CoA hydratase [Streptomyces sp. SID10244]